MPLRISVLCTRAKGLRYMTSKPSWLEKTMAEIHAGIPAEEWTKVLTWDMQARRLIAAWLDANDLEAPKRSIDALVSELKKLNLDH